MADNIAVTEGSGKTVATDDVGGVQYQVVKLDVGGNGSSTPVTDLATSANQQTDALTDTELRAAPVVVDLGANNDVTVTSGTITAVTAISNALPAGTNAIGKLAANSGVDIGDVDVTSAIITGGAVAHDSADSGNPIKVGAKATAALSGATLVAAADRTDNVSDLDGAQIVRGDSALGDVISGTASNTDGTSTQVLAAGAAGVKHYLTDITLANTSASNIYVELKDNATTKWVFPVPANGGVTHSFRTPLAGTAATAWNFDASAATSTLYCSVSAFKSKV